MWVECADAGVRLFLTSTYLPVIAWRHPPICRLPVIKSGGFEKSKPPLKTTFRHGSSFCPAAVFFFSAAGQMGYGVELLLAVCGKDNTFRCREIIYGLQHELHAIRIATLPGLLHSHPKISNYTLAKTAVTVMMSLLISAKISPFILRISCLQM